MSVSLPLLGALLGLAAFPGILAAQETRRKDGPEYPGIGIYLTSGSKVQLTRTTGALTGICKMVPIFFEDVSRDKAREKAREEGCQTLFMIAPGAVNSQERTVKGKDAAGVPFTETWLELKLPVSCERHDFRDNRWSSVPGAGYDVFLMGQLSTKTKTGPTPGKDAPSLRKELAEDSFPAQTRAYLLSQFFKLGAFSSKELPGGQMEISLPVENTGVFLLGDLTVSYSVEGAKSGPEQRTQRVPDRLGPGKKSSLIFRIPTPSARPTGFRVEAHTIKLAPTDGTGDAQAGPKPGDANVPKAPPPVCWMKVEKGATSIYLKTEDAKHVVGIRGLRLQKTLKATLTPSLPGRLGSGSIQGPTPVVMLIFPGEAKPQDVLIDGAPVTATILPDGIAILME